MKYSLFMILCSYVAGECMPPHEMKIKYNDLYDCMKAGHEQSIIKMNKLGREQTNEYKMYFKFVCFNNKEQTKGEPT